MYGEVGSAFCRAYTFGFLTGAMHLITLWIDYLGYATMHYCQVMVIGFCGCIEVMMLIWNAHDGGPIEEAIYETQLTIATYYVMLVFSAVKGVTGIYVYKSFAREYQQMHGSSGGADTFWSDDIRDNQMDWQQNRNRAGANGIDQEDPSQIQ